MDWQAVGPTGLQFSHHDFNARTEIDFYHEDAEKTELLRISDALKHHRVEIAAFFASHEDRKERGDFIKGFFDNTYVEKILSNGQRAGYRAYDDVLTLWRGAYLTREKEVFMHWEQVGSTIHGMILLNQWLGPNECPLPSVNEQISFIEQAELEKGSAFVIPQTAIDYVLCGGSGVSEGKFRIYEQYQKKQTPQENIAFLKKEYGWGGHSDAIPGSGYWKQHDTKGISISCSGYGTEPENTFLLKWPAVEKRLGELIAADRYFNRADKEYYPRYQAERQARNERWQISDDFNAILREYNDFQTQTGSAEKCLDKFRLGDCSSALRGRQKKSTYNNDFALPTMRDALQTIISEDTYLTERCEALLVALQSDAVKVLEPTAEELNPPPAPEMEYVVFPGDTVYLGSNEYEVLFYDDHIVKLSDVQFPLFTEELQREEFHKKLKENPLNQRLLQVVEAAPDAEEANDPPADLDSSKALINEYCMEIFESEADFSDLSHVSLAFGATSDSEHTVEVSADLVNYRLLFQVDGTEVSSIQCAGFRDLNEYLANLDFDEIIAFAETEYAKQERPEPVSVPQATPEPAEAEQLPPPAPKPREKVSPSVLHPEIPNAERHDYHITDDALGVGTPGTRFANNMRAIRLLKIIENENRLATPEEQDVLAQYVGWGGLADCFDDRHSKYAELKAALSDEEYAAARESTLTAFYTPPVVIRSMYQALENIGFKTGNILEPSCGIGHFIGMRPEALASSKIYGIELDPISGRIAQQLYQTSSIAVQGFEKTDLPDSFFDVAIGNVPFGRFKVPDKRYDKHNFLIHDYFFARTLDKVRPGGIIAFITSKGTMDKENPAVRKYIAQHADLLGAIRLPQDTFKSAAGTEVTSDILFFQKRDRLTDITPDWVHLNTDENGLKMNQYFVDNPHMIMGEMREVTGPYELETACIARDGHELETLLSGAIQNIHAQITAYELDDPEGTEEDRSLPADPLTRNFSYTIVDGKIYYRENSRMNPVDVSATAVERIKGLVDIRNCTRNLIELQTEDYPDSNIRQAQQELNSVYDAFVQKYGHINSRGNYLAFRDDSSYSLLSSLEVLDDEGNFVRKADMFSKRTIKQRTIVTSVGTASEALALSLGEKACVDMPYMMSLTGKTEQEIYAELPGVIFRNPLHTEGAEGTPKYLAADEYLSGNVREKLVVAKRSAELEPVEYAVNVQALEAVLPPDLSASEISVRLGSTWLPEDVISKFMYELLDTSLRNQEYVKAHYSRYTGEWNVEGKSYGQGNIKANSVYGTKRINAYKIIEETLNLRDVRIFDYDADRNPILNKKETAIAQGKQELIKQAFQDWIWKDPARRERLCKLYNEKFNSIRPREYDGRHLNFVGMNPEITLRPHQLNAIAHILYGGNTLLAHVVGAGKSATRS